jgi:hypothetical protein
LLRFNVTIFTPFGRAETAYRDVNRLGGEI